MPSHFINNLSRFTYPEHPNHNLRSVDQSILDRYYQSYITRLHLSGYQFPPPSNYNTEFGGQIPASFVCSTHAGLVFNPGLHCKCLVFVHDEEGQTVDLFVARYVDVLDGYIQMFGDRPLGIEVKLKDGVLVTGVSVRSDQLDRLNANEVVVL
jgi:hypothetical protein